MVYNSVLQGTCLESISSDADINKTGFGQFVIKEEKWVSRVHTLECWILSHQQNWSTCNWNMVNMDVLLLPCVCSSVLMMIMNGRWKMRMSPSWLLRLYPQLDYYELWQQQYAVWMQWCWHWIWQVCPCANNAWGWQQQYILLRGDIVVVHSVHFTRTKYYVLQIFAVQSN